MSHSNYENLRRYENKYVNISHLGSAIFFLQDIEAFEANHLELFPESPLAQACEQVADLQRQLATARQENERLKGGKCNPGDTAPDCASCKAEIQHIDEWTKDVEFAVIMTVKLVKEGERLSTLAHQSEWKKIRGATRKRAFEAIRRALPADLKETDPSSK
ncbi:hypothetical protein [Desulfovibrio inopinatus]|uniref:hypothetical protein n=1 Tax=Desulfovibrio inopinatus TaxID=102109 RepID=UPI00040F037F|nr:hypothetical protein [Desulfovibrio inopinatus]